MATHQHERPKNSFEYRMSKKVAELTQVVHMLFTRNHEKEVEMDALKESYEHEIELVLADAKGQMGKLESAIAAMTRQCGDDADRIRHEKADELLAKEAEWRRVLNEKEASLHEERSECQKLRDMLIYAQRDIETFKQNWTKESAAKSEEINKKEKELERIRTRLAGAEQKLSGAQGDSEAIIAELRKTNEKLDSDVRKLQSIIENNHRSHEQLLTRNKQLETDMKTMKVRFNKKLSEMASNQSKSHKSQSTDPSDELDRLRQEVQRYRLELSNRDNNFNRVFSEKQPVLVTQKGTSVRQSSSAALPLHPHLNGHHGNGGLASSSTGSRSHSTSSQLSKAGKERGSDIGSYSEHAEVLRLQGHLDKHWLSEKRSNDSRSAGKGDFSPSSTAEPFILERILPSERHPTSTSQRVSDDALHLSPPESPRITQNSDHPYSSCLPPISSTPEKKRLSSQLTKPKPISRALLYGK
ncbi:unnamed protein product [Lymnaea stagnalis]|uniref:Uncharacterized protein n=1 Tax=Lymnaea stagnalis TaxID=6523 RepID=A0AAV2IFZ0_LYMST